MFYMLQVFLVVSIPIFVLAGTVLLTMIAWTAARDFARTRLAVRRTVSRKNSFQPAIDTLAFHKPH